MAKKLVIEIKQDKILAIEGEFKNNFFEITKYAQASAEKDFYYSKQTNILSRQEKILNQFLKKLNSKIKKINIIVPDNLTFNHFTILPKLNEKEIYSAVKFQADQFIPLPLESIELDIDILEETVDKTKYFILIVGIEKTILNKVTSLCENLALIPERIENELSSLGKLFTYSNLGNIPDTMLINFEPQHTTLYFFDNKRKLIFNTHTFKLGYEIFLKELSLNTNIKLEEAEKILNQVGLIEQNGKIAKIIKIVLEEFINEIKQALLFSQTRHNLLIQNFSFLSEDKIIKDLDKFLALALNINPIQLDLTNNIKLKNSLSINQEIITLLGGLI